MSQVRIALIKEDEVQKKWTGAQTNMVHGIYELTFPTSYLSVWQGESNLQKVPGFGRVELGRDMKDVLNAIETGNIQVKNGITTIIGRFAKKGGILFFNPETTRGEISFS